MAAFAIAPGRSADDFSVKVSDDEWIAHARERAAAGAGWERHWPTLANVFHTPPGASEANADGIRCPYCEARPELETVRRYEVVSSEPLLRCPACFGFWAKGDALATGVRDPNDDHPSFFAVVAPPRCRACHGRLKSDETCSKCGAAVKPLSCPVCAKQMERWTKDGVRLDSCAACAGVWFDIGEIAEVYGLAPPQSWPASLVDEHAADDEPAGWEMFLSGALGFLGPFR